jgi:hypothetical protein
MAINHGLPINFLSIKSSLATVLTAVVCLEPMPTTRVFASRNVRYEIGAPVHVSRFPVPYTLKHTSPGKSCSNGGVRQGNEGSHLSSTHPTYSVYGMGKLDMWAHKTSNGTTP